MIELLQNKNSATKFQILVEIASKGPTIYQKNIATKLGITPQAVSEYIKQLENEDLIEIRNRYSCKVSVKGVDWMLKMIRQLDEYLSESNRAVVNITTCAAIAETDLAKGQIVTLKMKSGVLYATGNLEQGARGISVTSAKRGEDIGISNIEGLVDFSRGKITIIEVPNIQQGGSRKINLKSLQGKITENQHVGAIGIESLVALHQIDVKPHYIFGVAEAQIEEAKCGLSSIIVCTTDAISGLIRKIQDNDIDYEIKSLTSKHKISRQ